MDAAAIETAQPWALCGLFPRLRGIGKRIRVRIMDRTEAAGHTGLRGIEVEKRIREVIDFPVEQE